MKRGRSGWYWKQRAQKERQNLKRRALAAQKRRFRKQVVVTPAPAKEPPAYGWRAPQAGQGRLSRPAATVTTPKAEKRATGQPRRAWHGKYDQLHPPPGKKPQP